MNWSTDRVAGLRAGLEQAKAECLRHAAFLKDEADRGGNRERYLEAMYLAERINSLLLPSDDVENDRL
jgi:hypothetical protein